MFYISFFFLPKSKKLTLQGHLFLDLHELSNTETQHILIFRVGESKENIPMLNTSLVTSHFFYTSLLLSS